MLHHVSVGVADVVRAGGFYDRVLATVGLRRVMEFLPYAVGYGDKHPSYWVQLPHDRNPASIGNGVHICFAAPSRNAVQAFHAAALANGGTDDGAPGPRPDYGPDYYGAFVRDPDGNKIEAVVFAMPTKKTKPAAKQAAKKAKAKPAKKAKAKAAKRKPAKTAKKKKGKGR